MAYVAVVYEGNIIRLIQVGEGATWTRERAWDIRALAVLRAPMRSGRLKSSHKVLQNRDIFTGRYRKGFNIVADARHAAWVHGGTAGGRGGWIYPRSRGAMVLPAGGGHPRLVRKRVHGQNGQPWLREAGEAIAHRYR
jgi:hypothetical protein